MYGFLIYVFFCIVERLSTVSIQQIHLFAMVFLSLCKKRAISSQALLGQRIIYGDRPL